MHVHVGHHGCIPGTRPAVPHCTVSCSIYQNSVVWKRIMRQEHCVARNPSAYENVLEGSLSTATHAGWGRRISSAHPAHAHVAAFCEFRHALTCRHSHGRATTVESNCITCLSDLPTVHALVGKCRASTRYELRCC